MGSKQQMDIEGVAFGVLMLGLLIAAAFGFVGITYFTGVMLLQIGIQFTPESLIVYMLAIAIGSSWASIIVWVILVYRNI